MECYIAKEVIEFCFGYIASAKTIGVPKSCYFENDENRSISSGKPTRTGDTNLELPHKSIVAKTMRFVSAKNNTPFYGDMTFYRAIQEI